MYFMVLSRCLLLRCARAHTYATLPSLSKMTLCWHTSNEFHKKRDKKPLLNISARLPARRDCVINFDILIKKDGLWKIAHFYQFFLDFCIQWIFIQLKCHWKWNQFKMFNVKMIVGIFMILIKYIITKLFLII